MINELHEDLGKANEIYEAIGFQPSEAPRDRVFGVLVGPAVVALGRLQRWTDDVLEVGGFWVREDRRGEGLARKLLKHVLAAVPDGPSVWCIAFEHLVPFYESAGMRVVGGDEEVPDAIRAKMDFCCSMLLEGRPVRTRLLRWR